MTRIVLKSRSDHVSRREVLHRIKSDPRIRVIDEVDGRLALVEMSEDDLARLGRLLPGWSVEVERIIKHPISDF